VIDRLALFANRAAAQARHDFRHRQFVVHRGTWRGILLFHQLAEGLGLPQRTREPVQYESALAMQAAAALSHHFPDRRVRHQIATAHVVQCRRHRRCLLAGLSASGGANISGGQMTSAEALVQQLRLRALSHSGCSEQHQPQAQGCDLRKRGALARMDLAAKRLDHFNFVSSSGLCPESAAIRNSRNISNDGKVAPRCKVFYEEGSELWQYSDW
jgi:hypothetical protein